MRRRANFDYRGARVPLPPAGLISLGTDNRAVVLAGWCPGCKRPLEVCCCEPEEPAELDFEARR